MAVARDLTRAMLGFGTMLRAAGLPVTTGALMDAVRALEMVDLMDRGQVYLALRTVLVSRMEEQPGFDRCFEAFWKFQADDGQGLEGLVAAVPPRGSGGGLGGAGAASPPGGSEEGPRRGGMEGAQQKQTQIALEDGDGGEAQEGEP